MKLSNCQSCGEEFNPDAAVELECNDEEFGEEFMRQMERVQNGEICPACAFEQTFFKHTMRDV